MIKDYNIGPLPIWLGPQASPELVCAPFELEVDDAGLVRLRSSEGVDKAVQAYAQGLAAFHTAPPGTSEWANRLADASLAGLKQLCYNLHGFDVLELGGGNVYCAERMISDLGARSVTIVDPAIEEEPSVDNLQVQREYFDDKVELDRKFDLAVSFSALEHVLDPYSFLRIARQHLTDEGVVLMKVPDCKDSFILGDLGICLHQHVSYFTMESLDVAFERAGFKRIASANYPGGLQILARKATPNSAAQCTGDARLLDNFDGRVRRHVARLNEFSENHRGGRVAFIGASVGLCNILHLSGIADTMDVEIFDGNPIQTGRYMPGVNTPIRLTKDKRLEKHSHIFIAPVNFVDEIKAAIADRLNPRRTQIVAVFSDIDVD